MDVIFAVRQMIEKYKKVGKQLYFAFIYLKKALPMFQEKLFDVNLEKRVC